MGKRKDKPNGGVVMSDRLKPLSNLGRDLGAQELRCPIKHFEQLNGHYARNDRRMDA